MRTRGPAEAAGSVRVSGGSRSTSPRCEVSRDFRLLWAGTFISALGSQFARVGLYVQVYALTGSPAAVGLLGVSGLIGNVSGTLVGASFIDAHDRRTVMIWTQVGHIAVAGVWWRRPSPATLPSLLLHVANALTWFLAAIDFPARQAAIPRLVGAELMPAAGALNQVLWQVSGILGPALAGLLIGRPSPTWAYAVDLVSYIGLLVAALAIATAASGPRPRPRTRDRGARRRRRVPLRRRTPPVPVDLRDRPRRDDLRDAGGAVPGARGDAVRPRARGRGPAVRRAGGRAL